MTLPIAPYWNWNCKHLADIRFQNHSQSHHTGIEILLAVCKIYGYEKLPIAPYWNWNLVVRGRGWALCSPNRTILELKLISFLHFNYCIYSQSHHTGIEIISEIGDKCRYHCSQSHHTGIEMCLSKKHQFRQQNSQSHHTGIEIYFNLTIFAAEQTPNRTILELKSKKV